MARERDGLITVKPEDFVQVTGAPYHPARVVGEAGGHLVQTKHWHVVINDEPWMQFGFIMGRLRDVIEQRDKLNRGIGVEDHELAGARFAIGPSFYWNSHFNRMVRMQGPYFAYAVWVNRLPNYKSDEVIEVQEVHY